MPGMIPQKHPIAEIYVPVKRRATLDEDKVAALAESILEKGLEAPILVRKDDSKGLVLVEGLHRMEACRALGEETITCLMVQARQR